MTIGREYPNGLFYRRACKMMGIDPDHNPNYETEGDKVIVPKEKLGIIHNDFAPFFEHICKRLSDKETK